MPGCKERPQSSSPCIPSESPLPPCRGNPSPSAWLPSVARILLLLEKTHPALASLGTLERSSLSPRRGSFSVPLPPLTVAPHPRIVWVVSPLPGGLLAVCEPRSYKPLSNRHSLIFPRVGFHLLTTLVPPKGAERVRLRQRRTKVIVLPENCSWTHSHEGSDWVIDASTQYPAGSADVHSLPFVVSRCAVGTLGSPFWTLHARSHRSVMWCCVPGEETSNSWYYKKSFYNNKKMNLPVEK